MARFTHSLGFCGVRQGVQRYLRGGYGAGFDQFDNTFEMGTVAPDLRPERLHIVAWRRGRLAPRRDERGAAARLEDSERALRNIAANRWLAAAAVLEPNLAYLSSSETQFLVRPWRGPEF